MGTLVPAEFPMSSLKNDAERVAVQTLVDRLTDGWLVPPSVGLAAADRDREMDVVVAHPRDGIAVIEVKGHQPTIRDGLWHAHGRPMDPQPHELARLRWCDDRPSAGQRCLRLGSRNGNTTDACRAASRMGSTR